MYMVCWFVQGLLRSLVIVRCFAGGCLGLFAFACNCQVVCWTFWGTRHVVLTAPRAVNATWRSSITSRGFGADAPRP